ncbi:hypothetical protein V1264_024914 [Littorina saxatilis]|uniref:Uncharacterized protein n=1 Tax=Littorina saxatilis TaxID=31220 RepID=A0AAN9AMY3_9CAEN
MASCEDLRNAVEYVRHDRKSKRLNQPADLKKKELQMSSFSNEELQSMVRSMGTSLKGIHAGTVPCERHDLYYKSDITRRSLDATMMAHVLSEEQNDSVMDQLLALFPVVGMQDMDYILRVLFPVTLKQIKNQIDFPKQDDYEEDSDYKVSQSDMDCSESEGDSDQCQGGLQTKVSQRDMDCSESEGDSDQCQGGLQTKVSQRDMDCSESEGDGDQCQGGLQTKGIKHCV